MCRVWHKPYYAGRSPKFSAQSCYHKPRWLWTVLKLFYFIKNWHRCIHETWITFLAETTLFSIWSWEKIERLILPYLTKTQGIESYHVVGRLWTVYVFHWLTSLVCSFTWLLGWLLEMFKKCCWLQRSNWCMAYIFFAIYCIVVKE